MIQATTGGIDSRDHSAKGYGSAVMGKIGIFRSFIPSIIVLIAWLAFIYMVVL